MKIKNQYILLIAVIFLIAQLAVGQTINPNDLKNIKVDKLTDAQITALIKNAEEKGMTQEQLETLAISKGMPMSEIQKLKQRIDDIKNKQRASRATETTTREFEFIPKEEDLFLNLFKEETQDTSEIKQIQRIFGYSLFNNKKLTFEPSLNIPTPENYQLGPGDEVIINVWGASQQNYILQVNPEGSIYIDDIGPIYVNGLTIEKASVKIKNRLTSIYSGLSGRAPNTYAQISLGNLRSIKVNITGEAIMPGTYTLPSLATVFNALYYAGGPGLNGSFRNIKVVRNNKEIANIDLYEFLLSGSSKENIVLQDQDIIFIPTFKIRVEIDGEVKRPGIYELKENENFSDLITFCGDFTKDAYSKYIKITRNTDIEKEISDILVNEWDSFYLKNGDQIYIEPLIDRFTNRVEIRGAVYRQGIYELEEGLTLKQLINKADGLSEDAFMERAVLYRLQPNNKTEVISIDLNELMEKGTNDIILQREDMISIFSIFDLEEQYNISIDGEVQFPGEYPYYNNLKLGEIIAISGGLKESASLAKIDIARRIKNKKSSKPGNNIAEIFTFSISENLQLNDSALQFVLEPFDVVFIRKSPGYEEQKFVYIRGEVAFPGTYSLTSKSDRISDLVNKAGGFSDEAYLPGARLKRRRITDDEERERALRAIQSEAGDSVEFDIVTETEQSIGIDLVKIIEHPKSKYDLLMQEGDILEIPKQLQTVSMNGAFLYPITARYDRNHSFRKYISKAGGFAQNALKRKTYVIYANGSVKRTHHFFGIKKYPKIEPGAEIIVPEKPEKEKLTVQEAVSLGSLLTSSSLVIITLIDRLIPEKQNSTNQ